MRDRLVSDSVQGPLTEVCMACHLWSMFRIERLHLQLLSATDGNCHTRNQICLPFCSLDTEWYTKLWFSVLLDLMFIVYARHLCLSSFIYFLPVGGSTSSSFCIPTDISKFSFRTLRLLSARWHWGCISLLGLHRSTTDVVVYGAEMYFLTVLEATSHRWRYR